MSPSQNAMFTVTVKPAAASLTITPNGGNLPAEQVDLVDSGDQVCVVSGGTAPYTFAVSAGSLPPGMRLSNESKDDGSVVVFIEGSPTQSGAFSFTLTVTDSAGAQASIGTRAPVGSPASPAGNS